MKYTILSLMFIMTMLGCNAQPPTTVPLNTDCQMVQDSLNTLLQRVAAQRDSLASILANKDKSGAKKLKTLLGKKQYEIIGQSDSITYCTIDPYTSPTNRKPAELLKGYVILKKYGLLPLDKQKQLQKLMLNPLHHQLENGFSNMCLFVPGIAATFHKGAESVTVLMCFHCDEWEFHYSTEKKMYQMSRARTALLGLFKQLLTDNPAVQELKSYY